MIRMTKARKALSYKEYKLMIVIMNDYAIQSHFFRLQVRIHKKEYNRQTIPNELA